MADPTINISSINISRGVPSVAFGDVWYHPGGECGPRLQHDYQLVIVHLGEADVSFGDQACVIPPGSVALMLPGRREHYFFSRRHRTHHSWCAVHPDFVPVTLRKRLAKLPPVQPQSEAFKLLIKAAFSIGTWRKKEGQHMLRLLGLAVLEEYVRMAKEGQDEANRESPRERARLALRNIAARRTALRAHRVWRGSRRSI